MCACLECVEMDVNFNLNFSFVLFLPQDVKVCCTVQYENTIPHLLVSVELVLPVIL